MADPNDLTLTIYRGEDVSFPFTPADTDADADTDLTGAELTFTVATAAGAAATLTLTTADADEVEVTNAAEGEFSVKLTRVQTSALSRSEYRWDCWTTVSGSYQRVAGGTLEVRKPILPPL